MRTTRRNRLFSTQFLLLWQGQLVSKLGTHLFDIAMILWIQETTASASLIALILIASNIPEILLAPFGGTLADIFPRRNILMWTDLISGFLVCGFSLVLLFGTISTSNLLILLFIVSAGLGMCSSCFNPAVLAVIPDLVENDKLHSANGIYQATLKGSMLIGQSSGGLLFGLLGAPVLFLMNGISFIISAMSESFIKLPERHCQAHRSRSEALKNFKREFIDGFHYCWKHKGLKSMFYTIGVYHFFISPLPIVLPFLVTDTLHLGRGWVGFFLAGFGGGTLMGFFIAGALKIRGKTNSRFIVSLLIFSSFLFFGIGLSRNPWTTLLCLICMGAITGVVVVNLQTLMQQTTPPEKRGRLFGFLDITINSSVPLGLGIFGMVMDLLRNNFSPSQSPPLIFLVNGACILLLMIVIIRNKAFLKLLAFEP